MDSTRLFQLFIISLFSAAVALIGLDELSHRFIKSGTKEEALERGHDLIKDFRGEVNLARHLEDHPTPVTTSGASSHDSSKSEAAYGAISSGWKKLFDKLLP